jgi:hypothetical protein
MDHGFTVIQDPLAPALRFLISVMTWSLDIIIHKLWHFSGLTCINCKVGPLGVGPSWHMGLLLQSKSLAQAQYFGMSTTW